MQQWWQAGARSAWLFIGATLLGAMCYRAWIESVARRATTL
jgi:hypothetical protein